MNNTALKLSTADARRETVIASAIAVFAQSGYLGTSVAAVAEHAGISPAYVFKLYPSKELLFVTALEACFEQVLASLERGAAESRGQTPEAILYDMGQAYAELIVDRALLMLQVHAQSAASVPEIGTALRNGLRILTTFAKARSGAPDEAVQRFMAYGQLCHLIVVTNLDADSSAWSKLLTAGIRHL
ncbi:TetR/AcrR family transcriptional regulator [Devosia sp.]|uniref:TetR/AcrR family transcriptional regulator n=1 Tax=Devosia sp. TaxID=1871048 RepID=UPI003BAC4C60